MTATELHLLLRDPDQVEAFACLLERNEITTVNDGDAIVSYDLTAQGNARLRAMTLPPTTA